MSATHRRNRRAWDGFRRGLLNERGWRCERCGRPGKLEVHHVVPLHLGGAPFDPDNCEVLCRPCHIRHHGGARLTPEERAWIAAGAR